MALQIISKLCWLGLLIYHGAHALAIGVDPGTIFFANDPLARLGSEAAVNTVVFFMRLGAAGEIVLCLTVFLMGDTKLSYLGMGIAHFATASGGPILVKQLLREDSKAMPQEQANAMNAALLAAIFANILGFLCSGAKNDRTLQRSKSWVANSLLVATIFFETVIYSLLLMDYELSFKLAFPELDLSPLSATARGVLSIVILSGSANMIAATLLLLVLKPTRAATTLAALLHVLIGLNCHFGAAPFKGADDKISKVLFEAIDPSKFIHAACFGLLVIATAFGATPAPKPKTKTA